jgi:hypothetical protein
MFVSAGTGMFWPNIDPELISKVAERDRNRVCFVFILQIYDLRFTIYEFIFETRRHVVRLLLQWNKILCEEP